MNDLSKNASPTGAENYTGPDPSVECAFPPCGNRLRKADFLLTKDERQWCSKEHREASLNARSDGRCSTCGGSGGDPLSITEDDPASEFYGQPTSPCPDCNGTGKAGQSARTDR